MSDFWLGAFASLSAWFLLNFIYSIQHEGKEYTIDDGIQRQYVFLTVITLYLTVMVYVGVIP